jgi:hypothetical protein
MILKKLMFKKLWSLFLFCGSPGVTAPVAPPESYPGVAAGFFPIRRPAIEEKLSRKSVSAYVRV